MKALSIHQPYAWLIVNGFKDIENRSWSTKVRGRILIHASKTFDIKALALLSMKFPHIKFPEFVEDFGLGGIVGSVDITDVVFEHSSPWFEGPKGFVLENPDRLRFIPCRGQLGFFEPKAVV